MRRPRASVYPFFLFTAAVLRAADAPGTPVVAPDPLNKGGAFSVRIPITLPVADKATITFIRDPKEFPAADVTVDAKTIPGVVEVTGRAPDYIANGDYLLRIQLAGAR